jgi:hypothetical protein
MKMFHRGCTDVYRRVKVVKEEVSLDEGFYTFSQHCYTARVKQSLGNQRCVSWPVLCSHMRNVQHYAK